MIKENRFDWKWYLKDLPKVDVNAPTVFSCFSCGGGSCMGYELAGFRLLGNCEIDPKINEVYKKNLHPKYNYLMDIRDFNKIPIEDIPDELKNLDILDGSPPCTVFSTASKREKTWGIEKQFREGQAKQTLDDLFFVFLDTVERLQPKIVVAENVTGLIKGNAKYYVSMILNRFKQIGYDVQLFKLNAMYMDVPQKRERVFFIANRCSLPKLKLQFNHRQITFGEIRDIKGKKATGIYHELVKQAQSGETSIADVRKRLGVKAFGFNNIIFWDNEVAQTVAASGTVFRKCDASYPTNNDFRNMQTFPQDYDFGKESAQYICGMSVPPVMMANVSYEIYQQWLNEEK